MERGAAGALTGAAIPVGEHPLRTRREAPALQQHERRRASRAVLGRIPHAACAGGVALCREGKNTQQAQLILAYFASYCLKVWPDCFLPKDDRKAFFLHRILCL